MSIAAIQEALQQCQAVLFDLDGVIADTEPLKFAAYQQVFWKTFGVELPAADVSWRGKKEQAVMQYWFERFNLSGDIPALVQAKRSAYATFLAEGKVLSVAGVLAFLQHIKLLGKLCALATSSSRKEAIAVLDHLELTPYFDALVTRDDVQQMKPQPEVYLKAAQALGVAPENCLVFEDSQTGIIAAKQANTFCVALETSFSRADLFAADDIIADFKDLL
jgi:beta-phosphoglucomutase